MNSLNKQSSNSNKSSQLNVDENLYGAAADLSENATSPQKGASASGAALSSKVAARLRQEVHGRLDEQQQEQIHNSDSKRKQQMMRQ